MNRIQPCRIYPMDTFDEMTNGRSVPPPLSTGFSRSDAWYWLGLDDTGHPVLKSTSNPRKKAHLERTGFKTS